MSMIQRFKTIMASNVNAMLDKSKNPEKMVNQSLRELDRDFRQVKAEMNTLQANEQRALRLLNECKAEINKMQRYAVRSMEDNREDMARTFLEKKGVLVQREEELQRKYDEAQAVTEQMKQMHDKLAADIHELESRRSILKGKSAAASTQKKINEMGSSGSSMYQSMSVLDQMEDEVNRAKYEAEALAELHRDPFAELDDKQEKVKEASSTPSLDDELAKLREEVNGKESE